MRWDFFVRHYVEEAMQAKDPKYVRDYRGAAVNGVLYPRAGTLGGCTAHNAMILVYPHNADWDGIAQLTGDPSWNAHAMRGYFMRLENCHHRPVERVLAKLGPNPSRHGWDGWLHSEKAVPEAALGDFDLVQLLLHSAADAFDDIGHPIGSLIGLAESKADPNDWRLVTENAVGVRYTPLTTRDHRRMGTRERVLETAQKFPDRLHLDLDALVTRIVLDGNNRATGVEYLKGERLYRAHSQPATAPGRGDACRSHARGDPLRRRLQYPSAFDVVRHRTDRSTCWSHWESRCGSNFPESAGTYRTAMRSASSIG